MVLCDYIQRFFALWVGIVVAVCFVNILAVRWFGCLVFCLCAYSLFADVFALWLYCTPSSYVIFIVYYVSIGPDLSYRDSIDPFFRSGWSCRTCLAKCSRLFRLRCRRGSIRHTSYSIVAIYCSSCSFCRYRRFTR